MVDVQPLPLQILSLLLGRGGEVVTREELFERVWLGRPTVDNVLPNAITKLRNALGDGGAALIENVPRVGYRFAGSFERSVVGRRFESALQMSPGKMVAGREGFRLLRLLGQSRGHEVWLARHDKTGEERVYKFAADAQHVDGLKREATLSRVLRDQLGERDDIVRVTGWNFETAPFFLESEYGGDNMAAWALQGERLRDMPLPQRLAIFVQVAEALAAAHRVAVLHRDLKPGNLLLLPKGEHWQVRLADFGSGRLLEPERLAALGISAQGATLADESTGGTLMYIAPEVLQDQAATVASDVYALGVLLYQLVLGDLRRPLVPGWERAIADPQLCEDIAQATDGDAQRRTESATELARHVRELDARRAERNRRQAAELQDEQDRQALRRLRARRPWLIGALVSLSLGLGLSLYFFLEAQASRRALAEQYAIAQSLNKFLTDDLIAQANPEVSGRADLPVATAVKNAASHIDSAFGGSAPAVRAALHGALQKVWVGLKDFSASVDEGHKALAALQAAPPADALRREAAIRLELAIPLAQMGQLPEASAEIDHAERLLAQRKVADPEMSVQVWNARGFVAMLRFDTEAATKDYHQALVLGQSSSAVPIDLQDKVAFNQADALRVAGHAAESEAQFRALLVRQTQRHGARDARTCYTMMSLASSMDDSNRYDEAMGLLKAAAPCLSAALGANHLSTLTAQEYLGNVYYFKGRFDDAIAEWSGIVDRFADGLGAGSKRVINLRMNLAIAHRDAGHVAAAERAFAEALAAARSKFADTDPLVQSLRYHLADCRLEQRSTQDVAALLEGLSSEALNRSEIEPDWDGLLAYQAGRLDLLLGKHADARRELEKAQGIIAAQNPKSPITPALLAGLIRQAQAGR